MGKRSLQDWVATCLWMAIVGLFITACAVPQVSAEERLFLDLAVEPLDHVVLPMESFAGTEVGGLSAIAYDRSRNQYYALSDDRQQPRFYTLTLDLSPTAIRNVAVKAVTLLTDENGDAIVPLDAEGLALTPSDTLIISSEGSFKQQIPPRLQEFDLATGQLKNTLRLPERYLFGAEPAPDDATPKTQTQGIQENIGFEALTISAPGGPYEPFRLFAATEGPLYQDLDLDPEIPFKNRWLHYLIDGAAGTGQSTLLSEHLYSMDTAPLGAVINGLSEILSIEVGGHFLALERAFGLQGMSVKLYQLATGVATDTSAIATLQGDTSSITPIRKQLVADLTPLGPDNLEAMTLGPSLKDGTPSLIMVSDNNFDNRQ